jgi:hypothetical protein
MRRPTTLIETAGAAGFFLVATIVLTWPIARYAHDGLADMWDAKFTAWVLHWDYHQALHDPLHLFDANIFYPARLTLAFSENLIGAAVLGFPLYAAGASTLTVYNVLFLLGMFLSALGVWALARYVTQDPVASLLAGLVYGFCPWRLSQIPHIQFQWGGFLALAFLFLLKYLDQGRRRDQLLFALFLAWNAAANIHYGIFSVLLVGLVIGYETIARPSPETGRRVWGGLAAAAVAVLVVLPLVLPYSTASSLYAMERGDGEIAFFSGRPLDFLTAGWQNKLYGPLTQKWAHPEGDFFPGLVPLVLAAVALTRARRATFGEKPRISALRRGAARALDLLALAGLATWLLASVFSWPSIGPIHLRDPGRVLVLVTAVVALRLVLAFPAGLSFAHLRDLLRRMRLEPRAALFLLVGLMGLVVALGWHTPFYRFLVESSGPALRAIRVPARGIVLFDLAIAVLASWGLSRFPRPRTAAAFAIFLTVLEYRAFPLRVTPVEADPPLVDRWLAGVDVAGSVIEWPFAIGNDEVEYQFRSTAHWKSLVNGYSGFYPSTHLELAAMFEKKALLEKKAISPEIWPEMEKRECRLLVLHPHMIEDEPIRHIYLATLRTAVEEGRLRPIKRFVHGGTADLVFEFHSPGRQRAEPESDAPISAEAHRDLELLTEALNPPFGFIDSPREEEIVAPAATAIGWALDDSGVESVLVSFDGGPAAPAPYGLPHPGPQRVYPNYPDAKSAGFVFAIPSLPSGSHILTVTIVAKDRGQERMMRRFQVR